MYIYIYIYCRYCNIAGLQQFLEVCFAGFQYSYCRYCRFVTVVGVEYNILDTGVEGSFMFEGSDESVKSIEFARLCALYTLDELNIPPKLINIYQHPRTSFKLHQNMHQPSSKINPAQVWNDESFENIEFAQDQ